MTELRALSVRQPWAHAIVHFGKDIENRNRRYGHRGLTLIHASAGMGLEEYADAVAFMRERRLVRRLDAVLPRPAAMERGGIVGAAEVVGCISAAENADHLAWWMGPYGLVLRNARPLPFIECKGSVCPLFWKPDGATLERVRAVL